MIGLDSLSEEGANILLEPDAECAEHRLIGWTKNVADWIAIFAPDSGLQAAWYSVNFFASPFETPVEKTRREVRARLQWLHLLPGELRINNLLGSHGAIATNPPRKAAPAASPGWDKHEDQNTGLVNAPRTTGPVAGRKVFLVHGHDEAAKQATARFLEKLKLEPIILHEQASEGRTVIEKVEAHAGVAFAIVLLTPDDIGSKVGGKLFPRARQNVVLELGYFLGRLGRKHVVALMKGTVERPSDYDGVVYIQMDDAGAWKLEVFKELKAVGLNVDLNNVA